MRLSQQAQYAIYGMFDLAYNGSRAPVQVRVVGERQRIPARFLEQIFQRLRKADLVRGKRGPGGGYVLARPASEISLRDIQERYQDFRALTHFDDPVRSKTSTVSATAARNVPAPELRVARKSLR